MKLLIATRSSGKQGEMLRLLAHAVAPAGGGGAGAGRRIELLFPETVGLPEEPAEHALELGDTFEANARAKAEYFARRTGLPTVADDSGLEVFALGGEPGVRSKRWAAPVPPGIDLHQANNAELLRRLAGAPPERRRARYRCVLTYLAAPDAVPEFFAGTCAGLILEAPRGSGGFGYDPLFLSDDLGRTFGEASPEEKDAVSHRGRAVRAFRDRLIG